jgi:hypothetical protein
MYTCAHVCVCVFLFTFCLVRIPKVMTGEYQYHVLGMAVSEKSWIYLLTAQLLFGAGVRSFIPAVAGTIFGYLYDRNFLRLQSIRFPRAVEVAKCSVSDSH